MKEFILRTDLTVEKIEEKSSQMNSYDSIAYKLHNGSRVRILRSSGKITGYAVDFGDNVYDYKPSITTIVDVLSKFGTDKAKEIITSKIHDLVNLVCSNPFITLDTKIFAKAQCQTPQEIAEVLMIFYAMSANGISTTDDIVHEYTKNLLEVVNYINLTGYQCEIEKKESQQTTEQSNEIVL